MHVFNHFYALTSETQKNEDYERATFNSKVKTSLNLHFNYKDKS
jgi:hypothetical protein